MPLHVSKHFLACHMAPSSNQTPPRGVRKRDKAFQKVIIEEDSRSSSMHQPLYMKKPHIPSNISTHHMHPHMLDQVKNPSKGMEEERESQSYA